MAQPTFTSTPSVTAFTGTSGPILYKFTSTNYSNAGYRMEVEVWNDLTATKIADLKVYTDSSGDGAIDVSAFLKAYMSLDNTADLSSGTVYPDVNWIRYYIKTQEVWTASSESQQSFANRFAIYGGLQIGVVNNFTDYIDTTFNFLTLMSAGTAIKDYPFLISFKGLDGAYMRAVRKEDGATLDTTYNQISTSGIAIGKHTETGDADAVELTIVAGGVETDLSAYTNQGSGTSWTLGANPLVSTAASSKYLIGAYVYPAGIQLDVDYDIDITAAGAGDLFIYLLDASFNPVATSSAISIIGTGNQTGTKSITATAKSAYLAVRLVTSFGTVDLDITSLDISSGVTVLSEVKTVNILDECQNTVMLAWRNSLGGWESFPFTYNQEYTWHYSDRKAKRLTLYADNLTLSQWEAIQGLNTLGELYKTPITELTTTLDRTSATIGQSVYVLNSDGTKTGVNVIGQPNTTFTKRKTHSATVIIEYPELFLQ